MISWHIVDSATYKAGSKIEEDLYFLSDTKEIYRGSVPFTESVIMYDATPPATSIAVNRLYIDSATLEGKIHDGTSWHTVIRPVKATVSADDPNPVSSAAVIAYVTQKLSEFTGSGSVISSLAWDSDEHILTATKGDSTSQQIVFDGLGVSLSYTSTTGGLQLLDSSGNKIGDEILLPKEQFVQSGEYDAENKKIILYFDAEKQNKVEIDATALVDVYTGADTNGASVSVSPTNVITATIKVSLESGNTLEIKSDGLYVSTPDISGKMDKVEGAVDGNILAMLDLDDIPQSNDGSLAGSRTIVSIFIDPGLEVVVHPLLISLYILGRRFDRVGNRAIEIVRIRECAECGDRFIRERSITNNIRGGQRVALMTNTALGIASLSIAFDCIDFTTGDFFHHTDMIQ